MLSPPIFASMHEYRSRLSDADFWWPYVTEILRRHNMADSGHEPVSGVGGSNPAILYGNVVVKLFGYGTSWRASYTAECAAHDLLAADPAIKVPALLARGQLFDNTGESWPYMITTQMSGVSWQNARLSAEQRLSVAADLGRQVRRAHALRPSNVVARADLAALNVTAAAEKSSLPAHLIVQIDDYLGKLGSVDPVFVHGDLMFRHAFVDDGRLAGIIDWGDASVTDRHYELAKLHLDLFDCDKSLLRVFLESSDWPVRQDFAKKAIGYSLYRQAHGLTQHHTMDVFYMLPGRLPMLEIATLDELAIELFGV